MLEYFISSVEGILLELSINIFDANTYTTLWIAIITAVVLIVLKIVLYLIYRSSYSIFTLSAKKITQKSEIKKTPSLILNKTVGEYISIAEKGVSSDMLVKIAEKNVSDLRFIGMSLFNITNVVTVIENAFPVLGVLILLTIERSFGIFIVIAALFAVLKLSDIFLSCVNLKNVFVVELTKYVASQIGQFYSSDIGVSIANFKTTMQEAVAKQTEGLKESIVKLDADLVGVMRLLTSELTTSVNKSMDGVSKIAESAAIPLEGFKESMRQAEIVQANINEASAGLKASMQSLEDSAKAFAVGVQEYYDKNDHNETQTNKNLTNFINSISTIETAVNSILDISTQLNSQGSYIEKNQSVLDVSIQQYQATLEKMSVSLAEAFTKIVSAQSSSFGNGFTSKISEALNTQADMNNEMFKRLETMFDELIKQSQTETQAIINMKEQFDMNFENLKLQ